MICAAHSLFRLAKIRRRWKNYFPCSSIQPSSNNIQSLSKFIPFDFFNCTGYTYRTNLIDIYKHTQYIRCHSFAYYKHFRIFFHFAFRRYWFCEIHWVRPHTYIYFKPIFIPAKWITSHSGGDVGRVFIFIFILPENSIHSTKYFDFPESKRNTELIFRAYYCV